MKVTIGRDALEAIIQEVTNDAGLKDSIMRVVDVAAQIELGVFPVDPSYGDTFELKENVYPKEESKCYCSKDCEELANKVDFLESVILSQKK